MRPKATVGLWVGVVRILEGAVISLFAALVVVVLWGVISRYLPGVRPSAWTEEMAIYLLVWLTMLGAALGFRSYSHLGVDYFVQKLDPAAARLAAVCAEVAVLLFAGFALVYGGWLLVSETLATGQTSPVLGLPVGWFYCAVPLSGLFICAFVIEHFLDPSAFAGRDKGESSGEI